MSRTDDLSRRIKSINARITTVGQIYGKDSAIYNRIVDTIKKAGGNSRFSRKMFDGNLRQIAKATRALETIESSQYTSKAGRKSIGETARETFKLHHASYDDITLSKMYDVFKNSSFARFDEVYKGSSDLFVDAIMEAIETDELTSKQIIDAVNYFTHHLDEFGASSRDDAIEQFREYLQTGKYKYAKYM